MRNKALLEDEIGKPVTTMAYPFGYFNARVQRAVAAAGYEAACAVDNALAAGQHDRFAMPRLTVGRSTTMAKFQAAVAGRGVPALYLKERTLTKGYAVIRRTKWALRQTRSALLAERGGAAPHDAPFLLRSDGDRYRWAAIWIFP